MPVACDFLVVGSGIAGLTCALRCASGGSVLLVTKDRLPESSSQYAQGGIASVWSPEDNFEAHIEDALGVGAGLCHRDAVEVVVREGPDRVRDLATFHPQRRRNDGLRDAVTKTSTEKRLVFCHANPRGTSVTAPSAGGRPRP